MNKSFFEFGIYSFYFLYQKLLHTEIVLLLRQGRIYFVKRLVEEFSSFEFA
jgi:hypothetical protein